MCDCNACTMYCFTIMFCNGVLGFYCRPRMVEMSFVLKAVTTLLITLKRAPHSNSKYTGSIIYYYYTLSSLYPIFICIGNNRLKIDLFNNI